MSVRDVLKHMAASPNALDVVVEALKEIAQLTAENDRLREAAGYERLQNAESLLHEIYFSFYGDSLPTGVSGEWYDRTKKWLAECVNKCPRCRGNGRIEMLEHCPKCKGRARIPSEEVTSESVPVSHDVQKRVSKILKDREFPGYK